jgi:hypothetical protein
MALHYFKHLPGIKELKTDPKLEDKKVKAEGGEENIKIKTEEEWASNDDEMKEASLFDEEHPSKWQPTPLPMIEDHTFYDARSSHSSPQKDIEKAPRFTEEYDNPWKFPWTNPPPTHRMELQHQDDQSTPTNSSTGYSTSQNQLQNPRNLPPDHQVLPSSFTGRTGQYASHSDPYGQASTSGGNVIRPGLLTQSTAGNSDSRIFSTPGGSYQPRVRFGRQGGPTDSSSHGASALFAPPEDWSRTPTRMRPPNS